MNKDLKFETHCIRTQGKRSSHKEHSGPIFETSSYMFNQAEEARAVFADEFIQKLCALEGAEDGIATASGMAAVYLSLNALLRPGDHVLASRQLFETTHLLFTQVLSKWGVSHTYVDMKDQQEWKDNLLPTTRVIYTETPSNPGMDLADLKWLARFAAKNELYLIVDNCFATPYLQNPIRMGADVVIHSATKFIDGQGRTIGGAVLGSKEIIKEVRTLSKITGPTMSAFTAWLLSKSIETLAVRMERHCENALKLARFLEKHPEVNWVKYPFLPSHPQYKLARRQMKLGGGLLSFELKGGAGRARKFLNALQLMSITSNLGDTRTTLTNPATTTHSKLTVEERKASGITDTMIRVSTGLEHIDDIKADFEQAIEESK